MKLSPKVRQNAEITNVEAVENRLYVKKTMAPNMTEYPKKYLMPKEAAHYMGELVRTLERWRSSGYGPRYSKPGRKILYSRAVIDEWLLVKKGYGSTSEYPAGSHSMGWTI